MKQPARIDTRTSLEKLSGLLDAGRQQFGGLLGAIPVVGQMEAIDRGIRAAGQGNMTGVAEAAADIIPAGRLATRGIKALTKGKSTGLLGDVMNIEAPKYQGQHRAPFMDDEGFHAPLNALDRIFPSDIYSPRAKQLYGAGQPGEIETLRLANKVRNNPEAKVKIYRAVPDDVKDADINAGDWVAVSKDYAKQHGDSVLRGKYKILEKEVPAKTVYTNADSLTEYGYDPTGLGIIGGSGQGTDSTQLNRFETDADRRMAVAQRNAVEMLGLPPDNTAMDRAKAMGAAKMYRGAMDEVFPKRAISNAVWLSDSPDVARTYGDINEVMVMAPKVSASIDYKNNDWQKTPKNAPISLSRLEGQQDLFPETDARNFLMPELRKWSQKANKDFTQDPLSTNDIAGVADTLGAQALTMRNVIDDGERFTTNMPANNMAVFDRSLLRLPSAAFDPARRNDADLLALQGSQSAINLPNFERLLGLLEDSQ